MEEISPEIPNEKTFRQRPRCGVPDMKGAFNLESRFGDDRHKWTKNELTWL